ncbi:MAG: FMN-dependent NADH-azoreductase [Flavobacterium sp. BFFFF1]|uniref:FMN-dependent NADH-azoreductase n=1 Tax=Flavobacterium sp. BFFFF1 TaxID=2015557 RepID=UPI000BCB87A8|nr:NAD(P)H-dependent oxidoreductase [Flavobacterium sp. BFFFF1]OYU80740.1 MAG: FMN-dependent NADH-azoreductase [Flavobacterium sp. BFFFF1]
MKKILIIISSPRGAESTSTQLSMSIAARLEDENPGSVVTVRDLSQNPLPHLDDTLLAALFTPADIHSEAQRAAIAKSDAAIAELSEADFVVIGIPMYNFGIPSTVKAWIDHVFRAGVTFSYGPNGPIGLLGDKKIYLAIASGGIYAEGAMSAYDFTDPYLRKALGFIGLTDITTFRAEGLKMPDGDKVLQNVIDTMVV